MNATSVDTVVIGGGLGGLLAALKSLALGHRLLLLERSPRLGGRFTAFQHAGCEVSTGALHYVPHGDRGPLATLMADLGLPLRVVRPDVIASFHTGQEHFIWRSKLGILRLPSLLGAVQLAKIVVHFKRHRQIPGDPPFDRWLAEQTSDTVSRLIFERFVDFALSIKLDQIRYSEMRAIFKSVANFGLPAVPVGGCRRVIENLEQRIRELGGEIRLAHEAIELSVSSAGSLNEVRVLDRKSRVSYSVRLERCVSDIGPAATNALLPYHHRIAALGQEWPAANGLKLQVISDTSLVSHPGIMFCLGTKRISGLVQVTNAVPEAAPTGKHLVNTFQMLRSDDVAAETQLALEDLQGLYEEVGGDFEVIHKSAFRREWPVNRRLQGEDEQQVQPLPGLYMVGDAYKPSGQMMAEGVAGSVSRLGEMGAASSDPGMEGN